MNLGQSLGELQFRVWELEEQLEERLANAVPGPKYRKGVLAAVRVALSDGESLTIDEIAHLVREGRYKSARYRLP